MKLHHKIIAATLVFLMLVMLAAVSVFAQAGTPGHGETIIKPTPPCSVCDNFPPFVGTPRWECIHCDVRGPVMEALP